MITALNGVEAHIYRGLLESNNIPAFVLDEHFINAEWGLSQAIGGVRVAVPTSFYEQAKQIIEQSASINSTEQETDSCPKCGSKTLTNIKHSWALALLTFFIFHLPLPFKRNKYKCQSCGYTGAL